MMAAQTQQYPIQQQQPVQQVQSPNGQIKQAAQQQQGAPSPSESRKLKFNELIFQQAQLKIAVFTSNSQTRTKFFFISKSNVYKIKSH